MNTPTKEQRDKIDRAIDTVTSICSSGSISPSKAIAKVASDMKLTADYLPIIVRAYNTGAATIHREDAHTMREKAASYPIAYLDEVISLLQKDFPLNKKASVEKPRDTFWEYNANYYFPNAWDHIVEVPEPSIWDVKQASVKQCTVAKDKANKSVVSQANLAANEATRIKYAAAEERDNAISEIERVLCQTTGVKLATALEYAKASYGKEGVAVVDKLIKANHLEKTANYRKETFIPDNHPFAKAFEDFVLKNENLKKASAKEKEVLEYCVGAINSRVRPKDRYMDNDVSIDAMFKEGEMKRRKKDIKQHYQKKKDEFLKEAYRPLSESGVGGITGLEQLNHPGWVGLDRFERELMYGLADPAHEAKLRNIRVQTILTDLMNTDPYLKDKDPEEVIDAMNDIMEINPDLHKNKPMLRIALRQFMESGGMDIPTLGVLSEFGKEERERKSRERSQAESAAQQFASQQESARQANEKLRSEEMRAKEDRESRELIAKNELELKKKEYDLKEREFAKKYPELEKEHKGLVRRLVSAGMSVGEIAHNIRHPWQATSEAFTREWERERRDRTLKSHEEDMELNKREAEQLHAENDLMDSTLKGDILRDDMGRRAEILRRKQQKDYTEGVKLDKEEQQARIDARHLLNDATAYERKKILANRETAQDFANMADILAAKDNETKTKALTTKEQLGKAQNRNARLDDILSTDADSLDRLLKDEALENINGDENRKIKQRKHYIENAKSDIDWSNKDRILQNYEKTQDNNLKDEALDNLQANDSRYIKATEFAEKVRDAERKAIINEDPEVIAARKRLAEAEAELFAYNNTKAIVDKAVERSKRVSDTNRKIEGYGTTIEALEAKARAAHADQQIFNAENSAANTQKRRDAQIADNQFKLDQFAEDNSLASITARTNEANLNRQIKQAPYTASRYSQTLANAQQQIREQQALADYNSDPTRVDQRILQGKRQIDIDLANKAKDQNLARIENQADWIKRKNKADHTIMNNFLSTYTTPTTLLHTIPEDLPNNDLGML